MEQTTQASNDSPQRRPLSLRGLLALNAALLAVLALVTFAPGNHAGAQAARGRGEYTMVAGGVPGIDSAGIYIVDVANQEMVIMAYDQQKKTLDGIGYRSLAGDAAQRRTNRPTN
jgi:hypothetical protein